MKYDDIRKLKRFNDFQNNTNISLVNEYVYFAVDKVANSTIKQCLFEIEYKPVGKRPLTLYDKRASPLLSPFQVPSNMLEEVFFGTRFFRFAFVRNPYSRLLSCYLDRIQTKTSRPRRELNKRLRAAGLDTGSVSFKQFAKIVCAQSSFQQNSHWRCQVDDICYDLFKFDGIYKFEKLWSDMHDVSRKVYGDVLPEMTDRGVNSSPKKTDAAGKLGEYFDAETEEMVYRRFKRDFDCFGYSRL